MVGCGWAHFDRSFSSPSSAAAVAHRRQTEPMGLEVAGVKDYDDYRRSRYGEITHKALLVDAVGTLLVPSQPMAQDGRQSVSATMAGGENEAVQRLKKFAAECRAQPYKGSKDGSQDSIYGANFSCKISPWLAVGCISPRFMFDELKKTANRTISSAPKKNDGGSGSPDTQMNWLMFELLWRDFFRFITKKYSCAKVGSAAPATACTGTLA